MAKKKNKFIGDGSYWDPKNKKPIYVPKKPKPKK